MDAEAGTDVAGPEPVFVSGKIPGMSGVLGLLPLLVVFTIIYGGLFACVAHRRRLATRWVRAETGLAGGTFHLDRVWSTPKPPRRSLVAWRQWKTGILQVEGSPPTAMITGSKGSGLEILSLDPITDVMVGKRGNDLVNTWIEVRYGEPGRPRTLFLNDGAWLGWRPMLTSSNLRMADALAATIQPVIDLPHAQSRGPREEPASGDG